MCEPVRSENPGLDRSRRQTHKSFPLAFIANFYARIFCYLGFSEMRVFMVYLWLGNFALMHMLKWRPFGRWLYSFLAFSSGRNLTCGGNIALMVMCREICFGFRHSSDCVFNWV